MSLRIFVPEPDMNAATLMGRLARAGSKMGMIGMASLQPPLRKRFRDSIVSHKYL
ncbi:MAG: hypothetical protein PVI20_11815 [Desulfobacteraceae bacterium]